MTLYTIIAAAAAELISLPVLGPNILFPYGLAIGACASVIALNIIHYSIERAAERRKKGPVVLGFIVRVLLYGGALFFAVSTAGLTFAGAAIGLVLPHAALYVMRGLLPVIRKKIAKEPETVWVTDTRSLLFVKEPWFVLDKEGRTYLTHKHYRKIKVNRDGT